MVDVPIYTKAEMDAQLDRISALSAELETVKGERNQYAWQIKQQEIREEVLGERLEAAEAKLAGGEAVKPLLAYIRAIDAEPGARLNFPDDRWVVHGNAVGGFTFGDLRALSALTHPAPTHEDGSGEQCDRCQGNGEIVTDWDRYRHPHDGDVGDEAVAECPACNGEGRIPLSHTSGEVTEAWPDKAKFQWGDRVTKTKGSSWTGRVCGIYSTALTPIGYAVESENEPGSVQIYPEAALRSIASGGKQ